MVGVEVMKYYKDEGTGEVYAYDLGQVAGGFVRDRLVELTSKELKNHLNPPITAEEVRGKRNALLDGLDKVVSNPLRYGSYSSEQMLELITYRQDLLDITKQAGFPTKVKWPDKPSFI